MDSNAARIVAFQQAIRTMGAETVRAARTPYTARPDLLATGMSPYSRGVTASRTSTNSAETGQTFPAALHGPASKPIASCNGKDPGRVTKCNSDACDSACLRAIHPRPQIADRLLFREGGMSLRQTGHHGSHNGGCAEHNAYE